MKVAIIGANGQLGTDLVSVFRQEHEVIPLTHKDLDVTVPSTLKILQVLRPEVIINTAAYVRVDDAEQEPEKALLVNAVGALNVAKIARELGAINVYISSDYVFDGSKKEPYIEEDIPNPVNVYGASKYLGEVFTRNYSSRYYIIRVASLYGKAGARGKGGNFVEFIIRKAKANEEIKVVNDMVMSPTYTKDVAVALSNFLKIQPEYGTYHMVNEGFCTWYEFAAAILKLTGLTVRLIPIKTAELGRLAKRPLFSALRNRKLEYLGIRMRHWKEALRDYLREKGHIC